MKTFLKNAVVIVFLILAFPLALLICLWAYAQAEATEIMEWS